MNTKQEVAREAIRILTAYPQIVSLGGGASLTEDSATSFYNLLLPPIMEDFIYGFGLAYYTLTNPVQLATNVAPDSRGKYYSIPADVGYIIALCKLNQVPHIKSLIGRRGLRGVGGGLFTKISDGDSIKLHIPQPFDTMTIVYIQTDPSPAIMTALFKLFLVYKIAAQLSLKNDRQVYQNLGALAYVEMLKAQKFSLDNSSTFQYVQSSLAAAPLTRVPPKEYPEAPSVSESAYIRGLV